ncbi:MAG: AAA family ATPase [Bacteroidetes bacterium]|nr:AAA family ATPase [Bacteroidota bacterium]
MSSDFIFDRGPTEYFHGRKEIIDTFNSALEIFQKKKGGTIFLIQGAPGVGKTALLDVLSMQAKKRGWKTTHIYPHALWNANELLRYLRKRSKRQISGLSIEGDIDNAGPANLSAEIKAPVWTIIKLLQKQKKPLLLILDEAQSLGLKGNVPDDMKSVVISILKQIHNGDLRRPVMLLAGGLGTTESALKTLGISRYVTGCTVKLGRLDKESESAVIRDWLTLAGGAVDDPTIWIDSIAEHTHGWPQHIISYIKPAIKCLKSNNYRLTDEGLEFVLESGNEFRLQYYDQRAHDIDEDHRLALAKAVMDVPIDDTMTRPAVLSSLLQSGLNQKEADDLFTRALEQGMIDQRKGGRYGIPIPYFHNWLIDEYAKRKC